MRLCMDEIQIKRLIRRSEAKFKFASGEFNRAREPVAEDFRGSLI